MQTGTIIRFIEERGFGFVRPNDGGRSLFFYITAWQDRSIEPQEGQEVSFELANNNRTGRMRAVNVRLFQAQDAAAIAWLRR